MFNECEFMYDGINSSMMGVSLISLDTGMKESPFGYKRNVIEEKIPFKDKPYFYGFEKECLQLNITIGKIDEDDSEWTYEERKKLVQWFYQDEYKPFISLDNPEIIYYCTPVGDARRFDNSLKEGYAKLTLKCSSPYAYSPTYIDTYNYETAASNIIEICNSSNVCDGCPEIQIEMANCKDVSILNLTTGKEFRFENLDIGETVYVNNESKQIESDSIDVNTNEKKYRFLNFNKNWFKLVRGVNVIEINGDVNVIFRSTYPISI